MREEVSVIPTREHERQRSLIRRLAVIGQLIAFVGVIAGIAVASRSVPGGGPCDGTDPCRSYPLFALGIAVASIAASVGIVVALLGLLAARIDTLQNAARQRAST